jgi:hypothetical protein
MYKRPKTSATRICIFLQYYFHAFKTILIITCNSNCSELVHDITWVGGWFDGWLVPVLGGCVGECPDIPHPFYKGVWILWKVNGQGVRETPLWWATEERSLRVKTCPHKRAPCQQLPSQHAPVDGPKQRRGRPRKQVPCQQHPQYWHAPAASCRPAASRVTEHF